MSATKAAAQFERLADKYAGDSRISRGRMLVSDGLRVDGRFFVALVGDQLLVKLHRDRVAQLIAGGFAQPFESGKGRVMHEWALISFTASRRWRALADEALEFVGK